jgi:hypothetical protein
VRLAGYALAALGGLVAPSLACADELPPGFHASAAPVPNLAALFQLKFQLPEGRGLARLLLQAGVGRDDAAAAARLAAGHLGDGLGGCDIKVEISKPLGANNFKLERVVLMSLAGQTVIERRGGELAVASVDGAASKISSLI